MPLPRLQPVSTPSQNRSTVFAAFSRASDSSSSPPWLTLRASYLHFVSGKRNFVGQNFWARGFFVNTVGADEQAIRAYIRNQEKEDQRLEQLNLCR